MIITTTGQIEGKKTLKVLGLVHANSVRAKSIGKDILAGFRSIAGGEIPEYTQLMAESRDLAITRLKERAASQGANAILELRFVTAAVMQNAAEILAYGTAVVLEE